MRFKFRHLIILIASIVIFALGFYIRYKKTHVYVPFDFDSYLVEVTSTLPSDEVKFVRDLENALNVAFTQSNLNERSFVMVNATLKTPSYQLNVDNLKTNPDYNHEFYIASTYKPFMIAAFIDLLNIKTLDFEIPFKFQSHQFRMREMASVIYEYNLRDTISDSLITNYFAQDFKEGNFTVGEIYHELTTNEKYTGFKFTLREIIKESLGPSSNWTVVLMRDHLALNGYDNDKKAATALENVINDFLFKNKMPREFRFILSENAEREKKFNTMRFYHLEFLFDALYRNSFEIPAEIHEYMIDSMKFIPENPEKSNQRHEIKSIARLFDVDAEIYEKSGYIGFDLGAAPGLDVANGWDRFPQIENKRVIIFNTSTYARIALSTGKYVDLIYAIASPTHLGLDPYYEELNREYLDYKNNILDNLEKNIGKVLSKYSSLITSL